MTQTRIFVSHSHQDNEWCRPFVDALKAVGYDVWYDKMGLTGGAAWVAEIQCEVQSCDVFLLVLTPEAWASEWVQDELQLAIATRRRVLPLLLRNTQVDGFLLTTQWVTVIGEQPQVAARSVIMALESLPAPGRTAAPLVTTETLDELVTLCRSLATEKRYTEALSASGRALALDPHCVIALRLRTWILLQINEPRKAVETCIQALSFAQGEEAVNATRELVHGLCWLQSYPSPQDLIDYLAPLVSKLESGVTFVEIVKVAKKERVARSNPGWGFQAVIDETYAILRDLVPGIQAANVVREAVVIAKQEGDLELVELLAEGYYGYPPDKATSADVEALICYRDLMGQWKRDQKRAVVEQYVERLSR